MLYFIKHSMRFAWASIELAPGLVTELGTEIDFPEIWGLLVQKSGLERLVNYCVSDTISTRIIRVLTQ